jgi:thiamine biosynthesis lipoprotein
LCFWILLAVGLAGCGRSVGTVKLAGATMGTTWHVTYVPDTAAPGEDAILAAIESELDAVNESMSTYRPDSEISRFNRAPIETWVDVSPPFFQVLSTALEVGQGSGGAYDVTVGPLVDLWGFGPGAGVDRIPGPDEIEAALATVGLDLLRIDPEATRVKKRVAVHLDFSSLAKGYAVDRIAGALAEREIHRYLVEVGGEMRLGGLSGRGDLWRVAIEQPDSGNRGMAVAIELTDTAVATSGDYRNYFEIDGRRFSHSIDPRTGRPVDHDLVSVTVVHPSAMVADAWATALTVMGFQRAVAVAEERDLAVYFIRRDGEEFEHSHTEAFGRYLPVGKS